MATLDDKLLGEKLQNYCSSSSEDEDEKDEKRNNKNDNDEQGSSNRKTIKNTTKFIPESELNELDKWNGSAQNTGPKGVIKDWQRFKQLEHQKSIDSEKEKKDLMKKLALTCKTDLEETQLATEKQQKNDTKGLDQEILDDEFFEEYLHKKLEEMQKRVLTLPKFGKLLELTNDTYLNEIDKEEKNVTIVIHIYDNRIAECKIMNECLESLAECYQSVKFCKVRSHEISLSEKFRKMGCPALLVYKNCELIGNFVRLNDEFGGEFYTSDVETFLLDHCLLPVQNTSSIRTTKQANDSDSD